MKANLTQLMIDQHVKLKNDLLQIIELIGDEKKFDAKLILEKIDFFTKDLKFHLDFEDSEFYGKLLDKMKARDMDIEKTESFINQMKVIEKDIMAIFIKYQDTEVIERNRNDLKVEMNKIKELLLLRVELEEAGVYMYWEFLT